MTKKKLEPVEIPAGFLQDLYDTAHGLRSRFLFLRTVEPVLIEHLIKEEWLDVVKTCHAPMYVCSNKLIKTYGKEQQNCSHI